MTPCRLALDPIGIKEEIIMDTSDTMAKSINVYQHKL